MTAVLYISVCVAPYKYILIDLHGVHGNLSVTCMCNLVEIIEAVRVSGKCVEGILLCPVVIV